MGAYALYCWAECDHPLAHATRYEDTAWSLWCACDRLLNDNDLEANR